jgi:hypothetical protein
MQDAADLTLALIEEEDCRAAVQRTEVAIFAREKPAAQRARDAIQNTFRTTGSCTRFVMEEHSAMERLSS